MQQTYTFHVSGMHCQSCVILTESALKDVPGVTGAHTSLTQNSVTVTGEFGDRSEEQIMHALSVLLQPQGYSLSKEQEIKKVQWSEFTVAIPIALVFIAVFVLLQKLGMVNLVQTADVTYGTAFIIGLIASVSTCMAVIGGMVLSLSASFAKEGDKVRPQVMFHIGRFVSFFLFGGAIGVIGTVFQFGQTGMLLLGVIIALALLILGVNLLGVFSWAKKLQWTMPKWLGHRIHAVKNVNHVLTPLLIGVVTFFLPCGFTQSMQIYTLSTGNFWKGGLTMFSFALGTFPILALLSFSSLGIHKKSQSGIFYKTAGLIVIFFAFFNLINTLVGAGIIDPVFNF